MWCCIDTRLGVDLMWAGGWLGLFVWYFGVGVWCLSVVGAVMVAFTC